MRVCVCVSHVVGELGTVEHYSQSSVIATRILKVDKIKALVVNLAVTVSVA